MHTRGLEGIGNGRQPGAPGPLCDEAEIASQPLDLEGCESNPNRMRLGFQARGQGLTGRRGRLD